MNFNNLTGKCATYVNVHVEGHVSKIRSFVCLIVWHHNGATGLLNPGPYSLRQPSHQLLCRASWPLDRDPSAKQIGTSCKVSDNRYSSEPIIGRKDSLLNRLYLTLAYSCSFLYEADNVTCFGAVAVWWIPFMGEFNHGLDASIELWALKSEANNICIYQEMT